jgi:hypothetical protein
MPSPSVMPRREPLDIFIHIPKTAGSTLNSLLLRHYAERAAPRRWAVLGRVLPGAVIDNSVGGRWLSRGLARGCSHLELHARQPQTFDALLARADWVSGHLTRAVMEGHMARIGRPARYVTLLRDPTDQVASHYQWWIEIFARGPWRYWRYDGFARSLSRRIRATDNSDPRAIIPILSEHWSLFLNLQSTYVLKAPPRPDSPDWWHGWDDARIAARLDDHAGIGLGRDIAPAFRALTGQEPPPVARLNESRSSLDRAVFRTPEMQAFLAERNACDIRLFEIAKAGSGAGAGAA